LHTTLHRCPRNSLEQFGQIDDTSRLTFEGRRLAAARLAVDFEALALASAIRVSIGCGAAEKIAIEFGVEGMPVVVPQIQPPENMNICQIMPL